MQTRAFQGLVPDAKHVQEVATVPYDVVSTEEARALAEGRPYDLLHVDRAEIDLPKDTDPYSDSVYKKALETFQQYQEQGVLVREEKPCVYLYQQVMGDHRQTGIALACHIDDYENDVIKKHEKTRPVKENDRTRLVGTLSAHTGPIFLTYPDVDEIDAIVAREQACSAPVFDIVDEREVRHRVWRLFDCAELVALFKEQVPVSYVADGHHRIASAWRVGTQRRDANPDHRGDEDYNYLLGVLFPASQLMILPYNRLVKDLAGMDATAFLERLGDIATVEPSDRTEPTASGETCLYLEGQWHLITWPEESKSGPIERLDVSLLQNNLLGPLLGIDDPRTDERIDFVGGIRGTSELEKRVDSGEWKAAFSMYPVTVHQLMEIADAGEIMPPKSTWFEPKLRSGLFIHTF